MNGQGEHGAQAPISKLFKPNPYPRKVEMLDLEDLDYITSKYGIEAATVYQAGWYRTPEERGFAFLMPVFGPLGELRGSVVRQEFENGKKEVRNYKILDGNFLCWYRTSFADVVVVEDQISAAKASKFATTVALIGAHLSPEKLSEIKQVAGKGKIFLARDKDATSMTFDDLKRYRALCDGNLNGLVLSKDLKNMSYEEIRKVIP
jgi:hypothetical protein